MNCQIWKNQMGHAITTPAVTATFRRSVNWSNGPVASNRHSSPGVSVARELCGRSQYGPRSRLPSDSTCQNP